MAAEEETVGTHVLMGGPEMLEGLVAYPSMPTEIGQTILAGLARLHAKGLCLGLSSWEETDIPGKFITSAVIEKIDAGNILVADVTALNFNVVFEIGYAIGRKKRVFLIRNATLVEDGDTLRVGIFDTLGYQPYTNVASLESVIAGVKDLNPSIEFEPQKTNTAAPVYLLLPELKGEFETRLIARVKKARLFYRSFDPDESGRLSALDAIADVASSHGVVIPLLGARFRDARVHNLRAAFVAGLSQGMEKPLLMLQLGSDPVPLDYRDLAKNLQSPEQIDGYVGEFATEVTASLQAVRSVGVAQPATLLARLSLGAPSAENEFRDLSSYYVQTDEFSQALRGEAQVVLGRKGAGKTALFFQLRDRLRPDKKMVVLDLKPEGFQLLKFKEQVLDYLEEGTRRHTVTVFWEYLLLLEVCHKLLQQDELLHLRDHNLYDSYRQLAEAYSTDEYVAEGDFAERMLRLTQRISDDFASHRAAVGSLHERLNTGQITELIYKHDVETLYAQLRNYLQNKKALWILFDNLDKGWPAHGVGPDDVLTLGCLLDAMAKIRHAFGRSDVVARGVVFIRNDVYEHLVAATADRGKLGYIVVDWTDPELLLELLHRRFLSSGELDPNMAFEDIWRSICVSHVACEESSHYLIDRCLMRPRCLIELLRACRSHAVNLGHQTIQVDDIEEGEAQYSTKLVNDISYELQDVCPKARDILYEMLEIPKEFPEAVMTEILDRISDDDETRAQLLDLLLWYGVLGFRRSEDETAFIYSVGYDVKRLATLIDKRRTTGLVYVVNPAFWKGLECLH
jgi:hypothetical protein